MNEQGELMLAASGLSAELSADRRYRFLLVRQWDTTKPLAAFVMLNPSTADEREDDPTIRRCRGFARDWGCGGIVVANLFAWRATDPRELRHATDPVGEGNDSAILRAAALGRFVVCAWGTHGLLHGRGLRVVSLLRDSGYSPMCLGVTTSGQPAHPLYLARTTNRRPYPPEQRELPK